MNPNLLTDESFCIPVKPTLLMCLNKTSFESTGRCFFGDQVMYRPVLADASSIRSAFDSLVMPFFVERLLELEDPEAVVFESGFLSGIYMYSLRRLRGLWTA